MSGVRANYPNQVYGGNGAGRENLNAMNAICKGNKINNDNHSGKCICLQQEGKDTSRENCWHLPGAFWASVRSSKKSLLSKSTK